MSVRTHHDQNPNSLFFVTFTCYKWLHLFQLTNAYDTVYKWFDSLQSKNIRVTGYVIMPNHLHVLLHFPQMPESLNTIIGNAKRFMAYEIIKRLNTAKDNDLLDILHAGVSKRERKKGQIHKVFEESFDAKECDTREFTFQKLNYIHYNPIRGKWQLVKDYTLYEHSSASFYERGILKYEMLLHVNDVLL